MQIDATPMFTILHSLLYLGLDTDEEQVRGAAAWVREHWSQLRKVMNQAERRVFVLYLDHVDKHKKSIPSRSDIDQLIREKQKNQELLDLMSEYDRYVPDMEAQPATSLGVYLEQRKADYEKVKVSTVLDLAGHIVVGGIQDEKTKKMLTGPRDAIKYLLSKIEDGLLLDSKHNVGGDTAEVGASVVAEAIKKTMTDSHVFMRSRSPLDLLEIGPTNEIKWVGIAGFTNHRKSTLLFTLCYLAGCQGFKVLIVPRECSVEAAWRKFIWLHAYRMKIADLLPPLVDSRNPDKLTPEHEALVRWLGDDMKQKGIRIDVRNASDWSSVNASVHAYVDEPYDVLAVDYIGHLDTPGAKDQREGIREVYRVAQALSQDYEEGRGLCILTPMQISKTEVKSAAAGDKQMSDWGVYEPGNVGVLEYHTDAARGMDALIAVWSGPEFKRDNLLKVSCIKSRGKWFDPFFLEVHEHTQFVRFIDDANAYQRLGERAMEKVDAELTKRTPKAVARRKTVSPQQIPLEAI